MNGNFWRQPLFYLLIVLVVVIVVGWWYLSRSAQNNNQQSPTATTTQVLTAADSSNTANPLPPPLAENDGSLPKSETYVNSTLGFGFSYLSGLVVSEEVPTTYKVGGDSLLLGVYSTGTGGKILWGQIGVNEIIKDTAGPSAQNVTSSKTTVAGVSANQRLITDAQSGFKKIDEFFVKNGTTYELQFEYSTPQAQAIANKIIQTFYAK